MLRTSILCIALLNCLTFARAEDLPATITPLTAAQTEFFESKIRPVLVSHCYECHSVDAKDGKKLKAGLLLDNRPEILSGGDSGPAIVPHNPDESLLLEALRYETLKMPPKGKLPDAVIADFETWIKNGAPDPRNGEAPGKRATIDIAAGRAHWAYQPVRNVSPPAVQHPEWPLGPIDHFILHRLESTGLQPSADADKTTLVRRVYFDLIGLPPTPEQIDSFVNAPSHDAYVKLVDQLLASPDFGVRWGRHWLDVVRFGESVTLRGFLMPEAWRYRDYVIDTFNHDRPYNEFLIEQVAGDLMPADAATDSIPRQQQRLIATAFLTLGNTNLEEQDKVQLRMDVVDEQLDVISKGFLAQTVTCARCHDHKFDPIPTRDYYALAGILRNVKSMEHANVSKWLELPLPVPPDIDATLNRQDLAVAALQEQLKKAKDELKMLAGTTAKPAGKDVISPKSLAGIVVDDLHAKKVGEWKLSQSQKPYIGDGYIHDLDAEKGQKTLTFQPELPQAGVYEVRLAYTASSNRAASVPVTVFSADGEKTVSVNQQTHPPIDGRFVSLGQYRFEQNGQGFVIISNDGTQGHVIADAVQFISLEALNATTSTPPAEQPQPKLAAVSTNVVQQQQTAIAKLETELEQLTKSGIPRPLYMSVQEEKTIEDCPVHIRGTVHNLGEKVPRGFLQVATWNSSAPLLPVRQSGRLELGAWLADRQNPLTARVMANRVWYWLLGSGIVRTVDNFGTTGETPSHPELIDYLAQDFMERDWSVKSLVRSIVLSRTYQTASVGSQELLRDDPENRLFGRANRRRLDAEALLDSMLHASEQLDRQMGGPVIRPGTTSDFSYDFRTSRRAAYWPVLRNSLPELFEAFDFPDPSMVSGRRNVSTVAPQALFFMNSEFVIAQSDFTANHILRQPDLPQDLRVDAAFRRILGRLPSPAEKIQAQKFVLRLPVDTANGEQQRWSQLVQALFGSLDFRYVH